MSDGLGALIGSTVKPSPPKLIAAKRFPRIKLAHKLLNLSGGGVMKYMTWDFVGRLGKIPAVQLSAIFPFIGHYILFGQKIREWFAKLHSDFVGESPALAINALSWADVSLYCFYYGLLTLGIGSIVYNLACPTEVRKSNTESDYAQFRKWTDDERGPFLENAKSYLKKLKLDRNLYAHHLIQIETGTPDGRRYYYKFESQIRRPWIIVVAFFYSAGLFGTIIAGAISVVRITAHLYERL